MKKLIAGNWKMHGSQETALTLARDVSRGLRGNPRVSDFCDMLICPSFLHIPVIRGICEENRIFVGAQDCSMHESGAFTGEVSAAMIKDCGAHYAIIGHSERRYYHGETDAIVAKKASAAHKNGLISIICIGETLEQREKGQAEQVVSLQLADSLPPSATVQNTVIAYEPVWAIGTGKSAQAQDIAQMHFSIRQRLIRKNSAFQDMRILYGGSVKPEMSQELFEIPHVNGALIGGASLKVEQFLGIALATVKD